MSKIEKLKLILSQLLELENTTSDKGIITWDGEEPIEGNQLWQGAENEKVKAEKGTYTFEIGEYIFTVECDENGIITSVEKVVKENKEEAEESTNTEESVNTEEVTMESEEPSEPTEESTNTEEKVVDELEPLKNEIEALKIKVEDLTLIINDLKEKLDKVENTPVAMSAEVEFEQVVNNKNKLKGALKYAQALNK